MGQTIVLSSTKGGCGKTTTSAILAGAYCNLGYRVAVLDADYNQSLAKWVRGIAEYPITVEASTDERQIIPIIEKLEANHDVVIVDTAGAATQATVFAIGVADVVIVPCQLSNDDVTEAFRTIELVKNASTMARREIPARVLLTDYQPNTNIAEHTERQLTAHEVPMFRTRLRRLVVFKEMTFNGEVPASGTAGTLVSFLVDELQELGIKKNTTEEVA